MTTYAARLCWNSKGWRYPTGEAAIEGGGSGYVIKNGFGHEEWLLDFSRQINGWHYAFLQGVNQSRNRGRCLAGQTIRVILFTVSPNKEHFRIGCLERCQVLRDKECDQAFKQYRERGWIKHMAKDLEAINGNGGLITNPPEKCFVFNIRFRKEDYTPLVPYEDIQRGDWLFMRNHYVLTEVPPEVEGALKPKDLGTRSPLKTDPIRRPSQSGTTYDPVHNRLQNLLLQVLKSRYGDAAVVLEKGGVDVQVEHKDLYAFFEVKSNSDARLAIREALGQVLEYAYFPKGITGRCPRLFVAAPGRKTAEVEVYLGFLKKRFDLTIEYIEVDQNTEPKQILSRIS